MLKTFTIPTNNKEVFISPSCEELPGLIDSNKKRFQSYGFEINGIPFSGFREQTRSEILRIAGGYTEKMLSVCSQLNIESENDCFVGNNTSDKTIIQTGHAPTLAHPGVLIKSSLTSRLAKEIGGVGVDMVVDNDVCHDNYINVPNINGLNSAMERVGFMPQTQGLAFEEIKHSNPEQLNTFKENVLRLISNSDVPDTNKAFSEFMDITTRLCGKIQSLSDLFTYAKSVYLQRFGINNLNVPVSFMCQAGSFWNFFLHITGDIKNFAGIYNAKLEGYRKLKKIKSKANPLPDLEIKEKLIELPFWIWKDNGPREKLFASVVNHKRVDLIFDNNAIVSLGFGSNKDSSGNIRKLKSLENTGIKIRPKAVTNTMYSRMFFSDLFIHGVGGAKYDLITDEIIKGFFGVAPPEYAVISATLHLPYETYDVSHKDAENLKQVIANMGRHPEKYVSTEIMKAPEIQSIIDEKKELITREAQSHEEKQQTFNRLKQINNLLKEKIKPLIKEKEKEAQEIEKKLRYNTIVTNREYPFSIYPESMLGELFKI